MRRRVQQQQLCRAEAQDQPHGVWRGAAQMGFQHGVQGAGAAQHGGGQAVGGGAVARLPVQAVQRLVERAVLVGDGAQQLQREQAGGVHSVG